MEFSSGDFTSLLGVIVVTAGTFFTVRAGIKNNKVATEPRKQTADSEAIEVAKQIWMSTIETLQEQVATLTKDNTALKAENAVYKKILAEREPNVH